MNNKSGMSTAAIIALIIGVLLLLSSCSLQSTGKAMFTLAVIVGLGLLAFAIAIACVALKRSSEEASGSNATKVQGTSTSARKNAGTTGMRTSERVNGAINSTPELKSARQTITEEKLLVGRVKDEAVREAANKVLDGATKVLETLATKQEKIKQSHQYLNYYLPTLGLILKKFDTLEANGMATDAMRDKVVKYLEDINEVMVKQYEYLYTDDILDLAVEMEAMTISCKRDGFLSDEDVAVENGEQVIKLEM